MPAPAVTAAPLPEADGARVRSVAAELTAVVVVVMAVLARLHPAPAGPQLLPWERALSSLSAGEAAVVRAAFAALPDVERGVAARAPVDVAALRDELVPPFADPAFTFERRVDGDVVVYVGRGDAAAPLAALLLHVQPTTAPAPDAQDEEHHRVVDPDGAPRWLHGSVWIVPRGQPGASVATADTGGVAAPVALGYLRVRAL